MKNDKKIFTCLVLLVLSIELSGQAQVNYDPKPLEEVQNHIKEHGHLPNIPSAKEMEENGIQLGEMNMKFLGKIEELTLYVIQQQKEIESLKTKIK
ncbi:MAG: hypothetical protein ABJN84_04290 [Flavobacteriaceae bacterium]